MRTFEIMVEDGEKVIVAKDIKIDVVERYNPPEDAIIQAGYDVVQITTENYLDIMKIDSKGTVWRMADCFESGYSSYNGKEVESTEFWEECKEDVKHFVEQNE